MWDFNLLHMFSTEVWEMNESLLLKWWCMETWNEKRCPLEQSNSCKIQARETIGSLLWKLIRGCLLYQKTSFWFTQGNPPSITSIWRGKLKVGDGRKIYFWKDIWLNGACLASVYPLLFRRITNKDETIGVVIARKNETLKWDFQTLYELLDRSGILLRQKRKDQLTWDGCSSNKYLVSSMYRHSKPQDLVANVVFDFIWKYVAAHRVQCFAWLIQLGRVKNWCLLASVGYNSGCTRHIVQILRERSRVLNSRQKINWDCIPIAVLWSIWNMRNKFIFDNVPLDWVEVVELIKLIFILWVRTKCVPNTYSLDIFINNLDSILATIKLL